MKMIVTAVIAIGLLGLAGNAVLAQSGNDLFQQALVKERTEGNIADAIKLYQTIVQKFGTDRKLAARALVQMGQCYEKLGSAEAQKTYARVVRDYADQREMVAEAQTRLTALNPGAGAGTTPAMTVREVWTGPYVDAEGAPSPDGRFLTFIDWTTGDVAVRNLATGERRRLTNRDTSLPYEYGQAPIVSPDGTQVAYGWWKSFYDLRVVPFAADAARTPRVIYRNEDVPYLEPFAWSPDGKELVVLLQRKDASVQMALVRVADGSTRILRSLEWRWPSEAGFSPDGRFVVYDVPVRQDSPDRDIFILSVDGRQENPLVQHPAIDRAPVWTPDGKRVMFVSDRRGTNGLWMIQVAAGKPAGAPELVKAEMGAAAPLGLSRDGSLFYAVRTGTEDVYAVELNPQTGEPSSAPARFTERFVGSNLAGAWSPDGQQFAYFSRRGAGMSSPTGRGPMPVVIRSVDTGEEREFFSSLQFNTLFPTLDWFPDGRSLLLTATNARGREGLHRMDAQTGVVTPIRDDLSATLFNLPTLFPRISPNGRTVYYSRRGEGEPSSIMVYDTETGIEKELWQSATSWVSSLALSRDGRRLAFFTAGKDFHRSLHVMPTGGGTPREIFRPDYNQNSPTIMADIEWTLDDRFILFVTAGPGVYGEVKRQLWRIPPDGSTPQEVVSMEGLLFPRVHPDGRRLAFTAGNPFRFEVWVMQNFLPPIKADR